MSDSARNPGAGHRDDDWQALARRLGIDPLGTSIEGPRRGPLAGPSDETPLDKMLRLSAQMEQIAGEIASLRSATYRAQLWHQWDALWRCRPPEQARRRRLGPAPDGNASPFV